MRDKREWVAIILAVGIATAVNAVTFAMLWEAIFRTESAGLSDNGTQILVTAFGGIIGVLGSYIGFRAGNAARRDAETTAGTPASRSEGPTDDAGSVPL